MLGGKAVLDFIDCDSYVGVSNCVTPPPTSPPSSPPPSTSPPRNISKIP